MRFRTTMLGLLTIAVLVAVPVACGDDDDDATTEGSTTESAPTTTTSTVTTTTSTDTTEKRRGTCEGLTESADGRYTVADAGEVLLRRDGDALIVEQTLPNEGWTAQVDLDDDDDDDGEVDRDDVDVVFRSEGAIATFDADIDDGQLEIEVCQGDPGDDDFDDLDDFDDDADDNGDDDDDDDFDDGPDDDDDDDRN